MYIYIYICQYMYDLQIYEYLLDKCQGKYISIQEFPNDLGRSTMRYFHF